MFTEMSYGAINLVAIGFFYTITMATIRDIQRKIKELDDKLLILIPDYQKDNK